MSETPMLCQNDRAGTGARPEPCRDPVKKTIDQATIEIMVVQNIMLMTTAAVTSIKEKNFLIFFTSFQKVKLKAKGRLSPLDKALSKS